MTSTSTIDLYTITLSGKTFILTKDRLKSDPDNYFTTYFFGGFEDTSQGAHEIMIQKELILFKMIQSRLRGYDILPIRDTFVPPDMIKEGVVSSLSTEAQ